MYDGVTIFGNGKVEDIICFLTNNSNVSLNGTGMSVLAILRQRPDSSRDEIADKILKTVKTMQQALDSFKEKGYI